MCSFAGEDIIADLGGCFNREGLEVIMRNNLLT